MVRDCAVLVKEVMLSYLFDLSEVILLPMYVLFGQDWGASLVGE